MRPWEEHYPTGITADAPEVPADLTTAWRARVEREPDGLALLHAGERVTAAELDARAAAFAALLAGTVVVAGRLTHRSSRPHS